MKSVEDRYDQLICTIDVDCFKMDCKKDCKKIANFWYRFAFETIQKELRENCAWWKFEDLQEFINEELKP